MTNTTTRTHAERVTAREAKRLFEAGQELLVSERGHCESLPVGPTTTTHTNRTTDWATLSGLVSMWSNRYPNQRYYLVVRGA